MESFHHALNFKYDLCIGCSHCTSVCPTGAIHIENGSPVLDTNRCVDCGRCYLACPVNAIYIEQDDFQTIYNYKCPVVLIPSIFSAQFPEKISQCAVLSAIYHLGFKYVYEVEKSVDLMKEVIKEQILNGEREKPIISSFCPAIVRLIQVKYPSLVPNILPMRTPLDLTTLYIRKRLTDQGIPAEDIGIFYVTPCAASIAAVKSPVGEATAPVEGVINMNYLYNKVFRVIKEGVYKLREDEFDFHPISQNSLYFTLTGGEIKDIEVGRNLAIDEIHNVSEFLEKLEDEDIDNIDYLELRACDESCAGGILCAGNRFLIEDRQKKRAQGKPKTVTAEENKLLNYVPYLREHLKIGKVSPRSMDKLDDNIAIAMRKMKRSFEINEDLPQVDCRICGYQTCKAFSEAIVNNEADVRQCIFVQRILEQTDKLTTPEALKLMRKVWGEKKIEKHSIKHLDLE